jgi:hypothetical protein
VFRLRWRPDEKQRFWQRSSLDWLLLLSMAALALNTHGDPVPLAIYLGLLALGSLRPQVLHTSWLWLAIVAVQGGVQVFRWEGIDDHVIVGTYWALAIALGLAVGAPARVVSVSARWMIGLIFLFAATWKWVTPEFRDGSFFTLHLLADPRFKTLADLVGGVDAASFDANRQLIGSLYEVAPETRQVRLGMSLRISQMATVMTQWGLLIESVLALVWLAPLRERWVSVRHFALILFCATTYGLVAISGFGTILLVMGMASVEEGSRLRTVYAVGIGVLAAWTPLWSYLAA